LLRAGTDGAGPRNDDSAVRRTDRLSDGWAPSANEGGEDVQEAKDHGAGVSRVGSGQLEFEEVEAGEAFDGGAAGDGVVTGTLSRRGAAGAFGDVQGDGDRRAVELVGEFRTAQRKPANNDAAELEGECVGVEATLSGDEGLVAGRR